MTAQGGRSSQLPIYSIHHLRWSFTDSETKVAFELVRVWPSHTVFWFRATGTAFRYLDAGKRRVDAGVTWQMYTPSVREKTDTGVSGGYFDPTLRLDTLTDDEHHAFAFAASLVHQMLSCDDAIVSAPRGLTEQAVMAHMNAIKKGMDSALMDHLTWFMGDAVSRGDLTAGRA